MLGQQVRVHTVETVTTERHRKQLETGKHSALGTLGT